MRKTGKQQITDAKATAKKQAELKEEFIKARKAVYSTIKSAYAYLVSAFIFKK